MRAFARSPFALVAALVWGFAEATRFWLIPDILLGWITMNRPRAILSSVLLATIGALAGGAFMHLRAVEERRRLPVVPGISRQMLDEAHERFVTRGWVAMVRGPLDGIPYKVYAVESATAGRPLRELVAWTPLARAWRFLVTAAGGGAIGLIFRRSIERRASTWLTATIAFWTVTYIRYFASLRNRYR